MLGLLGGLISQSVANPGGHCDSYEYKNVCPHCPYQPHHDDKLDHRHGQRTVCYKDCPREWEQCKSYDKRGEYYSQYSLDYSQGFSCPNDFNFKVIVNIEEESGEQVLKVHQNHQGGGNKVKMAKRGGGISSCNLGVYESDKSVYNPSKLNYNNYCHGDACSVPVKNLPGYPNLCNTEIYLAVGNNMCYDRYGHNDDGYHQGTKYVQVKISCAQKQHEKPCYERCCCPH